MTNIFHFWLVVIIFMGVSFIKCTYSNSSLPLLNFIFKAWCCGIIAMLYLAVGSPQHLYRYMKIYLVIGFLNLSWSKRSDKIINDSICIILWSNMCMVSIREDIIPNPPFQSSGQLLVILSVSGNMDFGDTKKV